MSLHPVLPPLLLVAVALFVVGVRTVALRRSDWTAPWWRSTAFWRWAGVTAAALLLTVAAARPLLGSGGDVRQLAGADAPNVFLVVDRSAGMGVTDGGDGRSRMAAVRDDVAAVLDRYPDARVALIGFASKPSLDWPLSADVWSLRPVVSAVTPYPATVEDPAQGNVAAAGNLLRYQLLGASQQYPLAENLVFYFGAGAGESRADQRQFTLTEGTVDGGAVLGYGTPAGGPIPGAADAGDAPVRSSIDEQALRAVAGQIGVPYVPRDGVSPLATALPDAGPADGAQSVTTAATPPTELYWSFAIVAAALLLVELYLVLRDFRRTRAISAETGP